MCVRVCVVKQGDELCVCVCVCVVKRGDELCAPFHLLCSALQAVVALLVCWQLFAVGISNETTTAPGRSLCLDKSCTSQHCCIHFHPIRPAPALGEDPIAPSHPNLWSFSIMKKIGEPARNKGRLPSPGLPFGVEGG